MSYTTKARIIGVDLGMKYKKKQKTHKLTDKQAAQRLARGPTLRRWLSRRKLPYIVTLGEMCLFTNDTTGERDCYYVKKGKQAPNDTTGKRNGYYETKGKQAPNEYKKKECSGCPSKILCAMGVCHRGSTLL